MHKVKWCERREDGGSERWRMRSRSATRAVHFFPHFLVLPAVTNIFIAIKRNSVLGMIFNIGKMLHRKGRQRRVTVKGVGEVKDWL